MIHTKRAAIIGLTLWGLVVIVALGAFQADNQTVEVKVSPDLMQEVHSVEEIERINRADSIEENTQAASEGSMSVKSHRSPRRAAVSDR